MGLPLAKVNSAVILSFMDIYIRLGEKVKMNPNLSNPI
jgi:hypothetical protein